MKTQEVVQRFIRSREFGHSSTTCIIEGDKLCSIKRGIVLMRRLCDLDVFIVWKNQTRFPCRATQTIHDVVWSELLKEQRKFRQLLNPNLEGTIRYRFIPCYSGKVENYLETSVNTLYKLLKIYCDNPAIIRNDIKFAITIDHMLFMYKNRNIDCVESFQLIDKYNRLCVGIIDHLTNNPIIEAQELLTQLIVSARLLNA